MLKSLFTSAYSTEVMVNMKNRTATTETPIQVFSQILITGSDS